MYTTMHMPLTLQVVSTCVVAGAAAKVWVCYCLSWLLLLTLSARKQRHFRVLLSTTPDLKKEYWQQRKPAVHQQPLINYFDLLCVWGAGQKSAVVTAQSGCVWWKGARQQRRARPLYFTHPGPPGAIC
ncbi:hypothetical protein ABBQ38_012222 [Trebouxia sp. C0009 RCD-2024]